MWFTSDQFEELHRVHVGVDEQTHRGARCLIPIDKF